MQQCKAGLYVFLSQHFKMPVRTFLLKAVAVVPFIVQLFPAKTGKGSGLIDIIRAVPQLLKLELRGEFSQEALLLCFGHAFD